MSKTTKTEYMLTTKDNPYSPFKDFDKWYNFDERIGYRTCGLLARTIDQLIVDKDIPINEREDPELTILAMDLLVKNGSLLGIPFEKVSQDITTDDGLQDINTKSIKDIDNIIV